MQYTIADYVAAFDGRKHGSVGVDPDGDLVWVPKGDQIVWAYGLDAIVLDWPALCQAKSRMAEDAVLSTWRPA